MIKFSLQRFLFGLVTGTMVMIISNVFTVEFLADNYE